MGSTPVEVYCDMETQGLHFYVYRQEVWVKLGALVDVTWD